MSVELRTRRRLRQSRSESVTDRKGCEVPDLQVLYVPQAALNEGAVRSDKRGRSRSIHAQLVPGTRPSLSGHERSKHRWQYYWACWTPAHRDTAFATVQMMNQPAKASKVPVAVRGKGSFV